jgi:hypothetical protein
MASKRMSAALSVLKTRNFSKMFLRARRLLEFSHGLGHSRRSDGQQGFAGCPLYQIAAQQRNDAMCQKRHRTLGLK